MTIHSSNKFHGLFAAFLLVALSLSPFKNANALTDTVLYNFPGGVYGEEGDINQAISLLAGPNGSFYGVTSFGGNVNISRCQLGDPYPPGCGEVFKLSQGPNGQWIKSTLHLFNGTDGFFSTSPLISDVQGNLYGATYYGGKGTGGCNNGFGCGVVFELSPSSTSTGSWTETILHNFADSDGAEYPTGGLYMDANGNLFGAANLGGGMCTPNVPQTCGAIFELSPPAQAGGQWTEQTIISFDDTRLNGVRPNGWLIGVAPGVNNPNEEPGTLFGTTYSGGNVNGNEGVVFKLTPPSQPGGKWKETVLYNFDPGKGESLSNAGLYMDGSGNLYGTNGNYGICCNQYGLVYKIAPAAHKGGKWTETHLYEFSQTDQAGYNPQSFLAADSSGALYGTTFSGGNVDVNCPNGCGGAFKLTPPSGSTDHWTETVLHVFDYTDGDGFGYGMVFGSDGGLYGTASGGTNGQGVTFVLK